MWMPVDDVALCCLPRSFKTVFSFLDLHCFFSCLRWRSTCVSRPFQPCRGIASRSLLATPSLMIATMCMLQKSLSGVCQLWRVWKNYAMTALLDSLKKRTISLVRAFITFMEVVMGTEIGSAAHGSQFFRGNGPLPNESLLRHFLTWYADSGRGLLPRSLGDPRNLLQISMCLLWQWKLLL